VTLLDKLMILVLVAQGLLTVTILVLMGRERVPRVIRGEIAMADIAVERTAYPLRARLLSNSFDNQFQLPVLLYVGGLIALQFGVDAASLAIAAIFVALRIVHAAIHTTTNNLMHRFAAYCAGLAVLVLFWVWLVFRLVVLTPSI
jgi:hypothetical protein